MKQIYKFLSFAAVAFFFIACDKAKDLTTYGNGNAPVLTASSTTLTPLPSDSLNNVLTLNWTFPNYSTDSANMKYTIQIDSTGKNFSNPYTRVVTKNLTSTFIAKDLNTFLVNRGYAFNVPVSLDVRVISSYANNNEQLTSNAVKIMYTPYKIPPKVQPPASGHLYLVGDASAGGWTNPVPVPTQEFSKLDSVTYAGIFYLQGGKEYLALPVNGDWSHKYSVANKTLPGLSAGGTFGYDFSDNFPGPATTGWYRIAYDFQAGKFSVTPYTGTMPTNLFIVGDATPGGWNNPVPVPSQQLTRLNSSEWQITLPLTGGKEYLILPVNGDWSHKYSVANKTLPNLWKGGEFGYDLQDNFPGPPTTNTYTLNFNFAAPTTGANSVGRFTVK